jgi:A/G-specific adenine glycosylase
MRIYSPVETNPISFSPMIAPSLLAWYTQNARCLPWRGSPDAYAIWVSEVMLQQTRVETVIPYYEHWMKRFPTLAALGSADQQDVLAAWEGLGYYSRARNLHRSAQMVMQDFNGQIPSDLATLRKLPGVGRYTAGAIASIAFGQAAPTLDGNIRRVLSRVFNVSEDARSTTGERRLWQLAAEQLPLERPGDYNQAIMDLGAVVCTPHKPDCPDCPLAGECQAYALGLQEQRPVLAARPAVPHITVTAAVIQRNGHVLISQRPQHGLLGGLWEFPGGKQQEGEDLSACLKREICEELGVRVEVCAPVGIYRHAYTHFRVTLHAFFCRLVDGEPLPIQVDDLNWVQPAELTQYPMGKIDRQIASYLQELKKYE